MPYECQVRMMEKVIQGLQELTLLCAALAWQQAHSLRRQLQISLRAGDPTPPPDLLRQLDAAVDGPTREPTETPTGWCVRGTTDHVPMPPAPVPRIYFATRTHSQIAQSVGEVRHVGYRPRVSVLSSRDHLCVNPTVRLAKGSAAERAALCRRAVERKTCKFHANFEQFKSTFMAGAADGPPPVADLEDLFKFGETKGDQLANAELVFLPYNYIVDEAMRKSQKIDLRDAIVIFDEAHNLESVCTDSSSFELSDARIAVALHELLFLSRMLEEQLLPDAAGAATKTPPTAEATPPEMVEVAGQLIRGLGREDRSLKEIAEEAGWNGRRERERGAVFEGVDVRGVVAALEKLIKKLREIHIPPDTKHEILYGDHFLQLLIESFGTLEAVEHQTSWLQRAAKSILQYTQDPTVTLPRPRSRTNAAPTESGGGLALYDLVAALKMMFRSAHAEGPAGEAVGRRLRKSFKVHVQLGADGKERVLSLWCFNSGIAMAGLVAAGTRCVIAASGTLSPLESFECEMNIDFPIALSNPHVAPPQHFSVTVLRHGPRGVELCSSYERRTSTEYLDDLGRVVARVAETVPGSAGVLVFFAGYGMMEGCLERWKMATNGDGVSVWDQIRAAKVPVIEPKSKAEFAKAMDSFRRHIRSPFSRGAILFAVCRGKASEGVDFSDDLARAVIVAGIPYPAAKDPRVVLKREFMDGLAKYNRAHKWYANQAYRAVNQALGRVFADESAIKNFPKWLKPHIKVQSNFHAAMDKISAFFEFHQLRREGGATEPTKCEEDRRLILPTWPVPHHLDVIQAISATLAVAKAAEDDNARVPPRGRPEWTDVDATLLDGDEDAASFWSLDYGVHGTRTALVQKEFGVRVTASATPEVPDEAATQPAVSLSPSDASDRASVAPTVPAVAPKPGKGGDAKAYSARMKASVSAEAYRRFLSVLKEYKQAAADNREGDAVKLFRCVGDILLEAREAARGKRRRVEVGGGSGAGERRGVGAETDEEFRRLMRDFGAFVRKKHRDEFRKVLERFG
ncbi:Regulator of telomere elongation helicase 1 [Phlyctochytrium bullatum]|nr:Regulator of telomere elongation helicase 1 [Phlyctochytrium bullatum]